MPLAPEGSSEVAHGNPGSGESWNAAFTTFSLDSQVARIDRAVCVQQVSCVNFTSGGLAVGDAAGVGFAPSPPSPGPPRRMKPPTVMAKTRPIITTTACARRSVGLYTFTHIILAPRAGHPPDRPGAPCARRQARPCPGLEERREPRTRPFRDRPRTLAPRARTTGSGRR